MSRQTTTYATHLFRDPCKSLEGPLQPGGSGWRCRGKLVRRRSSWLRMPSGLTRFLGTTVAKAGEEVEEESLWSSRSRRKKKTLPRAQKGSASFETRPKAGRVSQKVTSKVVGGWSTISVQLYSTCGELDANDTEVWWKILGMRSIHRKCEFQDQRQY